VKAVAEPKLHGLEVHEAYRPVALVELIGELGNFVG
jgi:hypothetical protein